MADLRIYVACLASYNAGKLHGRWIDATDDADDMMAEINAMLRESPEPNVTRRDYECDNCGTQFTRDVSAMPASYDKWQCPECDDMARARGPAYRSAEEWAIHDYDGDHPFGAGEFVSLDTIAAWCELCDQADDRGIPESALAAIASHYGEPHTDVRGPFCETESALDEYQGEYADLGEWAYQFADDCGDLKSIPERYRYYINWDAIGRDARLNGDVLEIDNPAGGIFVFWNH